MATRPKCAAKSVSLRIVADLQDSSDEEEVFPDNDAPENIVHPDDNNSSDEDNIQQPFQHLEQSHQNFPDFTNILKCFFCMMQQ